MVHDCQQKECYKVGHGRRTAWHRGVYSRAPLASTLRECWCIASDGACQRCVYRVFIGNAGGRDTVECLKNDWRNSRDHEGRWLLHRHCKRTGLLHCISNGPCSGAGYTQGAANYAYQRRLLIGGQANSSNLLMHGNNAWEQCTGTFRICHFEVQHCPVHQAQCTGKVWKIPTT